MDSWIIRTALVCIKLQFALSDVVQNETAPEACICLKDTHSHRSTKMDIGNKGNLK